MTRRAAPEILDVGADNVGQTGFFCFMSKQKSAGYQGLSSALLEACADKARAPGAVWWVKTLGIDG